MPEGWVHMLYGESETGVAATFSGPGWQGLRPFYRWVSGVPASHSAMSDSLQPHGLCPPGSSVHGMFQARRLEWVAIPFPKESSLPRDQTWVSCILGSFFTVSATREVSGGGEIFTHPRSRYQMWLNVKAAILWWLYTPGGWSRGPWVGRLHLSFQSGHTTSVWSIPPRARWVHTSVWWDPGHPGRSALPRRVSSCQRECRIHQQT